MKATRQTGKKNQQYSNLKSNDGQMLVLMLLIMIVGLTVGLFLVGRTTTDIAVSTKIAEATRAFNAAEAGVEEAIRTSAITQNSLVPFASGASYSLATNDLGGAGIYPPSKDVAFKVGNSFTAWLVQHDGSGNLTIPAIGTKFYNSNFLDICFTTSPTTPAVVPGITVTVYYRDATGLIKSAYTGYDGVAARVLTNHFRPLNVLAGSVCRVNYNYFVRVNFNSDFGSSLDLAVASIALVAVRIRPVYADTYIGVSAFSPATLPKQGIDIVSTGNVGESTRKIQVKEPYLVPAPFMDSAIYSTDPNSNISK